MDNYPRGELFSLAHVVFAVFELGDVGVMSTTEEADVFDGVCTSFCVRLLVVELEETCLGTSPSVGADEAALETVALCDGAFDRGRDVPRALLGRGLGFRFRSLGEFLSHPCGEHLFDRASTCPCPVRGARDDSPP